MAQHSLNHVRQVCVVDDVPPLPPVPVDEQHAQRVGGRHCLHSARSAHKRKHWLVHKSMQ